MRIREKVVGTKFRFEEQGYKSYTDFKGVDTTPPSIDPAHDEGIIPTREGIAYLIPEPTNKFDPNAILVVAQLNNGHAFKLGYLKKNANLYNVITQKTKVKLIMYGYSSVGDYNDSYEIEVDLNHI